MVYRAPQAGFGRDVAIKVLSVDRLDEAHRRRFERETSTTGKLSGHPHIVTLHQAGFTEEGRPYLVMGYVDGGSLGDRVTAEGPLPWAEVVGIGINVAGALATAHAAGIIHRDVKPDNILIDDFGGTVLSDFGIASVTGLDGATMTAAGHVTGTIAYSPPEVLDGARPDERTDVFALGATVFALLAGHPPYVESDDTSLAQVLARMMRQDPPDLTSYGVPSAVAEVVARALSRDLSRRTPTAIALGQQLQDAQQAMGLPRTSMVLPQSLQAGGEAERTLALPGLPLPSGPSPANAPTVSLAGQPATAPTSNRDSYADQQQLPAQVVAREPTQDLPHPVLDPPPPNHPGHPGSKVAGGLVVLALLVVAGVGFLYLSDSGAGSPIAIRPVATEAATSDPVTPDATIPPVPPAPALPAVPPDPPTPDPMPTVAAPPPLADVVVLSGHPDALAIGATLQQWQDGINVGDYDLAFATYSPELQQQVTFDRFRDGNQTSSIVGPTVVTVDPVGGRRQAIVAFRSLQDPAFGPQGQSCSDWVLQWTMGLGGDEWLVEDVSARDGSPVAC